MGHMDGTEHPPLHTTNGPHDQGEWFKHSPVPPTHPECVNRDLISLANEGCLPHEASQFGAGFPRAIPHLTNRCARTQALGQVFAGPQVSAASCRCVSRTAARCIINLLIIHRAPDGHAEDQRGQAGSQRAPGLSLCQDSLFSHGHVVTGHLHVTGQSLLKSQLANNKVGTKPDSPKPDGPLLPFLSPFLNKRLPVVKTSG